MKIFSGTSNPQLSGEIASKLGVLLSKAEVIRFQNSEVRVTIQEDVRDQTCVVIQTTSNPTDENLMELYLFCDALKRSDAKRIIAVIPYFGYARQNVQHREGECVSTHVVIKFLEAVGYNEVYSFDLHEESSQGIFSIPYTNLSGAQVLAPAIKDYIQEGITRENVIFISPDQEGIERARNMGDAFFGDTNFLTGTVNKRRDVEHIHQSEALDLYGDVTGKTAILVDDICTSGGTLVNAANLCMVRGAKKVLAAITHHDFGPKATTSIQNSQIDRFFTTNTISLKDNQKFEKLHEVSVANAIVELLNKIA